MTERAKELKSKNEDSDRGDATEHTAGGVQLKEKKRYRQTNTLKQELKIALTDCAKKPKSENEGSDRGAATEHTAAGAEMTTCMKAIVTEWSTSSTDDARDLVNAAQVLLRGDQDNVRSLCKPWGVQLREKKR